MTINNQISQHRNHEIKLVTISYYSLQVLLHCIVNCHILVYIYVTQRHRTNSKEDDSFTTVA